MNDSQPVTVAICTRNRGAAALVAARSVLESRHPAFRLLVIDQSTNDESERALDELKSDPRFTYQRTSSVGLSRARNIALRAADTEVVVFTDDDCEVVDGWLEAMQGIFDEFPSVAVAFCSVRAGPFDAALGFVPAYECRGTRLIRGFVGKCRARGMGAGLAVRRRTVLERLGGFDEMLGAGATFPSCEDGDMAVRALLEGFDVCETDRTYVIHHGFRSWKEGRELGRRDFSGVGAAYAKPLRVGRWDFVPVPLYELAVQAFWPPVNDLLHLRFPRGAARTLYFLHGFAQGLRAPLDPQNVVFRSDV
ncbi:MAG TPA: glycosyltransferase family 2 protein [Polyangiaceae bacterium]